MAKVNPVTLKDTFGFSLFDCFPCLITTVTHGGYHFSLLPGGPPSMLHALASSQYIVNDLAQNFILGHDCNWYWSEYKKSELRPTEVLQ